MFCPNCGRSLPDGAAFCPDCGTRMPQAPAGPAIAAGPAQQAPPQQARPQQAQPQQAPLQQTPAHMAPLIQPPVQQLQQHPPPPATYPGGAFSPGAGPGADLTRKLPGRLQGANIFLFVILLLGVIGALWVLNGDIGGTTDRDVFYPYHWPDDVETVSYADEWYGVDSGGVFAAVIILVALLFLACAAVALVVILKPGAPRNGMLIGAGLALAIAILVVILAGGAAFDSWADDEDFNNWWLGSSYYGGITGAVLIIALFAYPMWADRTGRRMMATQGSPGQPMQPAHLQPVMPPGPGMPPPFRPPEPPQQPPQQSHMPPPGDPRHGQH